MICAIGLVGVVFFCAVMALWYAAEWLRGSKRKL
jgi:hypothetical protein